MNFEALSRNQKTRAALHRDVRALCAETCHFLGLEITKSAMDIISELVYKKIDVYGQDLEAFAKHAKRSTINSDDIKLLVRRNPSLKAHLNKVAPTPNTVTKEKRRKTGASSKQSDPPPKLVLPESENGKDTSKEAEAENETIVTTNNTGVQQKQDIDIMDVDGTIDLTFD
ncbi:hypothetical protein ACJJTC_017489 [Scirpophaga incertulas]